MGIVVLDKVVSCHYVIRELEAFNCHGCYVFRKLQMHNVCKRFYPDVSIFPAFNIR